MPSYSSLTITLTIVGSSIFYGDFKTMEQSNIRNFAVGVSIVGVGIILLSVLQACRLARKNRSANARLAAKNRRPDEGDALLPGGKGGKGSIAPTRKDLSDLESVDATSISGGSGPQVTIDGTSNYEPSEVDAASFYGSEVHSTADSGSRGGSRGAHR